MTMARAQSSMEWPMENRELAGELSLVVLENRVGNALRSEYNALIIMRLTLITGLPIVLCRVTRISPCLIA